MTANTPEPPPTPNDGPAICDLVIADMEERKQIGIEKYGTPLQAHNGRDALVDAYQEILYTAVYLRQRIEEGCCHEPHRIFIDDKLVQINADGTAEPVKEERS